MASDGQIVFEVTADGRHAIADIKEITRAIQTETGKWDESAKKSTDSIENNFSGMLKKLVAGFSAVKIGQALLNIGKDALEAASALEEVQNVVDVTFGDNAGQIEKWAKNAGTQFGLTETQAKKFTSTMGAMLKSSGMAGDEIVQVSTDLAGLAADMASFYNLDFEEAFSKIRSGISGQTMPLKELGIDMSVATLNAFALEKGLTKTFDQMTQSEQTMLRYQYLMKATSDAQGDFSRTSDGYANSIRRAETAVESIKTQLGQLLIGPAAEALTWIDDFLGKLTTPQTTVLDDFNQIEIDTDKKLAEIGKVAEEARLLTEELERIGGSEADKAGSKVQQIADSLSSIDLEQGKAGIVKDFVSTLATDIETLSAITGQDAEGLSEWLNGVATAADSLSPEDADGWAKLIESIKEGLPGIENTDFGANFFSALGGGFSDVEKQSSVLSWAIDALGDKTNKTADEQRLWLETCKRLVQTIPGLSSIINVETGEVKGGTQAVKDYIQAWEEGQTRLAMLGALEQKQNALSSRFADLPGLQLDMLVAEKRLKERRDKLQGLLDEYGINATADTWNPLKRGSAYANQLGLTNEQVDALNDALTAYREQTGEAIKATDAYNKQADALKEAEQALAEYEQTINDTYGATENAATATETWFDRIGKSEEEVKNLVENAKNALAELEDYASSVRANVASAVDSVVSGFEKITRPTTQLEEQRSKLIEEQMKLDRSAKDYQQKWDEIQSKIDNVNKQIEEFEPKGMKDALTSQLAFMNEYIANLEKAREIGLSAELLASLSDGSVQSAEYLMQLVANPEAAMDIDKLYQQVQEKKKEFTDELTQQQLSADQVYQSMAEEAKKAVAELDLEEEAKDNAGKTIAGMAQGINEHVSDVESAVDAIVSSLEKLNGWGINIDLGAFGSISFGASAARIDSLAVGMDYVPFDGYLAALHEGESVLTAEEARIWRNFKDGGTDYDALGGVMRDNIKPGGNVYLDGRVVGSVISDQQGKSYRQLQRSGWQG